MNRGRGVRNVSIRNTMVVKMSILVLANIAVQRKNESCVFTECVFLHLFFDCCQKHCATETIGSAVSATLVHRRHGWNNKQLCCSTMSMDLSFCLSLFAACNSLDSLRSSRLLTRGISLASSCDIFSCSLSCVSFSAEERGQSQSWCPISPLLNGPSRPQSETPPH